jgi:hypothetical protein
MVTDGAHSATFNFDNFNGALNFASDHHGGTLNTDPPVGPIEQQSRSVATASSGDQFAFKATLGDANGGRPDDFQSMHPDFDLNHSAIHPSDHLTAWLRSSWADLRKDLSIDLDTHDHRLGHDFILSNNMPGTPHDYIFPNH